MGQIVHPSVPRRLSARSSLRWLMAVLMAAFAVIGGALPASADIGPSMSVDGAGLPGTGTQVGLIAVLVAVALLVLGLVVLLLARRNRH
ncbi:hypothetical protein BHE97_01220 [Aeromicrobium sp. PE09-221]|uniref:LPXTG cell wall anchor domain-containing protein n=1 Tax=Aeromicrobium sp. PE09-221 TaxID=1898043 RepID=UPI000B3EAF8B|nr:LPXTG cell wall anchor domain-containing protein [Aeromicrobium sp. PE09-221]OUZ12375.1 hypothetical protein BHE97_01220 [Aeromicrobium sp. PE09-221]